MDVPVRRVLGALLPALLAVAVAGCGGGGGGGDATGLLDRAFSKTIQSGDLNADAEIELDGAPSLKGPLKLHASGPFEGRGSRLPAADIRIEAGTPGGPTVATGFVSTGDRAFVKFQDVYYEEPAAVVRQANDAIRRDSRHRRSLRALGLNPRSWLDDAKTSGDDKVAGVDTTHVTGKLDVERVLRDFNALIERQARAFTRATGQPAPGTLTRAQIERAKRVVKQASFDVYVGKRDDVVRRVAGRLELSVPKDQRERFGGLKGGSLTFSVQFANVGRPRQIEAPRGARPLSELLRALGGASALGGAGGGSAQPSGPSAKDFKRYSQCIDKAKPQDTDALQRCAELLQ